MILKNDEYPLKIVIQVNNIMFYFKTSFKLRKYN